MSDQKAMFKMMAEREAKDKKARVLFQIKDMVMNGDISFEEIRALAHIAYEKEQKDDARTSDE
jgi:hypothetical protein